MADAYTFELGAAEQGIKERALTMLARIDTALCARSPPASACPCRRRSSRRSPGPQSPPSSRSSRRPSRSPAGSSAWSPGRRRPDGIAALRKALKAEGALLRVIAPHGGQLVKGKSVEIVERTFATGRSIEFDAIVVADGAPKDGDFRALVMLQEAFRHLKAVGAWGDGVEVLRAAGIDPERPASSPGRNERGLRRHRRRPGAAPGLGPRAARGRVRRPGRFDPDEIADLARRTKTCEIGDPRPRWRCG